MHRKDYQSGPTTPVTWQLDQYASLKAAGQSQEVLCLFQKINASYPLKIQAATGNGWFDLQLTQQSFCGRFPPTTRGYRRARNEFQTIRWQTCRLE